MSEAEAASEESGVDKVTAKDEEDESSEGEEEDSDCLR